jgi:hypothetical protein
MFEVFSNGKITNVSVDRVCAPALVEKPAKLNKKSKKVPKSNLNKCILKSCLLVEMV